jgi:hypothetical protein
VRLFFPASSHAAEKILDLLHEQPRVDLFANQTTRVSAKERKQKKKHFSSSREASHCVNVFSSRKALFHAFIERMVLVDIDDHHLDVEDWSDQTSLNDRDYWYHGRQKTHDIEDTHVQDLCPR